MSVATSVAMGRTGKLVSRRSHSSRSMGAMHRLLTLTLRGANSFDKLPVRVERPMLATA